MYEHHRKPLLPKRAFRLRLLKNFFISLLVVFCSLMIGILGYHFCAKLSWIDSLLNASMILTGMGPVDTMPDEASKFFASFYALFSGVAFLSTIAILFAPIAHRFMHKFHIDNSD